MPTDDSLAEYEEAFWADLGENEPAVRAFVAEHRTRPPEEWQDPREIINRKVMAVFRSGINRYLRTALWHFLESERKRHKWTQLQVAQEAGISQPVYAKIQHGQTSFNSILLVLRALGIELHRVPSPSVGEQTAEGLISALDFAQRTVLGRRAGTFKPRREDIEWLRYLQACLPWVEALVGRDQDKGQVIAQCVAAAISIRLGRVIPTPAFEQLVAFWERWITAWELCAGAVNIEAHHP